MTIDRLLDEIARQKKYLERLPDGASPSRSSTRSRRSNPSADLGYENPGFFRRLFKRSTGLTPGRYRRMFQPFALASTPADVAALDPARPDRQRPPVARTAQLGPRTDVRQ